MAQLAALRSSFAHRLKEFASGSKSFTVLHSLGKPEASSGPLFVLDSSFNPPTRAHLSMALSALRSRPGPKRLLLLLATQNADKPSKPAAFEQRLVMMTLLGEAVREAMQQGPPDVDIGLIKMPYFHDKAINIDQDGRYAYHQNGKVVDAEQVYLLGYDSLLRIFDRKYYPADRGFAVLEPFLGFKHKVKATLRTDDQWGNRESQERYLEEIRSGRRVGEGIRAEWGKNIELVEGKKAGEEAVSSTEARKAAKRGDRERLGQMVVEGVREWIESEGLYQEVEEGKVEK